MSGWGAAINEITTIGNIKRFLLFENHVQRIPDFNAMRSKLI